MNSKCKLATAVAASNPQPGSPNHHWQTLGYTIERNGPNRTIHRPDGSVVDTGDGSHEDELRAIAREPKP